MHSVEYVIWDKTIVLPMSIAEAMAKATKASFCMMTCSLVAIEMRCWTPSALMTVWMTSFKDKRG